MVAGVDPLTMMSSAFDALLAPLTYPFEPSRRLFWIFLIVSVILAIVVLAIQQKSLRWTDLKKTFFQPRYWFNRSTFTDLLYLLGNSVLKALVVVPLLGSHFLAAIWFAHLLQVQLGNAPNLGLSIATVAVIYTLSFFVIEDASRFVVHRSMHRVPWLWYFHQIHHSATILTPLTLHRLHPVEMMIYSIRGIVVFAIVSGGFIYAFGQQLSGLDILGVDMLGFLFNAAGANLRHSHVWLSFGRLEKFLISPAQHQIHHSRAHAHRDKNFGTCLAVWDQLSQSIVYAGAFKRLRFGVRRRTSRQPKTVAHWYKNVAVRGFSNSIWQPWQG